MCHAGTALVLIPEPPSACPAWQLLGAVRPLLLKWLSAAFRTGSPEQVTEQLPVVSQRGSVLGVN